MPGPGSRQKYPRGLKGLKERKKKGKRDKSKFRWFGSEGGPVAKPN